MTTYCLGIDGGGTKTLARIQNLETGQEWHSHSGASSINNDFSEAVTNLQRLVAELLVSANCRPEQVSALFGLAGAGNPELVAKLKFKLGFDFRHFHVVNDATTSLYGANLGEPIAMVALGTGSVGARLTADRQQIIVGGWGFKVGDEGGGAKLGLMAVKVLLDELDSYQQARSVLAKNMAQIIGTNTNKVVAWLASAHAKDFATLTPHVFRLQHECAKARSVIAQHIEHVEQLISVARADSGLPVAMLGGLAQVSLPFINSTIKNCLVEAKGNSLDGACLLAKALIETDITGLLHNEN